MQNNIVLKPRISVIENVNKIINSVTPKNEIIARLKHVLSYCVEHLICREEWGVLWLVAGRSGRSGRGLLWLVAGCYCYGHKPLETYCKRAIMEMHSAVAADKIWTN